MCACGQVMSRLLVVPSTPQAKGRPLTLKTKATTVRPLQQCHLLRTGKQTALCGSQELDLQTERLTELNYHFMCMQDNTKLFCPSFFFFNQQYLNRPAEQRQLFHSGRRTEPMGNPFCQWHNKDQFHQLTTHQNHN